MNIGDTESNKQPMLIQNHDHKSEQPSKAAAPVGDSNSYKKQVALAKKKLQTQIRVLMLLSFLFSLGVFLAFFWLVK